MKKIFGALAVAALLASCGALDQKINYADGSAGKDDPIGLKGKAVTVSLLSGPAARLRDNPGPPARGRRRSTASR